MATNWLGTLNSGLQTAGSLLNLRNLFQPQSQIGLGGLNIPSSLAGAGLTLGSLAADKEPGDVTQARQFLRNRFTSPTALSEQFAGQIGGLAQQYQPLLTQQRQRGIEDIQQRFAAAFPKTVGAQGPEFGALSRYITDEALPREQAVLGDIGRQLLTEQGNAASTILQSNKGNPLADALGQLGGVLLAKDLFPGGTSAYASGMPGGGTTGGIGSGGNLGTNNALSSIGQLLGQTVQFGGTMGTGTQLLDQAGRIIGVVGKDGTVTDLSRGIVGQIGSQAGAATGVDFGLPGAGLLGPAGFGSSGALLSSVGSAGGGYAIGRAIGSRLPNETTGALGGAAAGAAAGFAIGGGPLGALIGAIAGGIGGFTGQRSTTQQAKASSIQAETQQTTAQRPAAIQSASALYQATQALVPELQQARTQLVAPVQALINQGDPATLQIAQATMRLPNGVDPSFKPTVAEDVLEALLRGVAIGNFYRPGNEANVESAPGLLLSNEVGKFGPGQQQLQESLATFQQASSLWQQLKQRLGGG